MTSRLSGRAATAVSVADVVGDSRCPLRLPLRRAARARASRCTRPEMEDVPDRPGSSPAKLLRSSRSEDMEASAAPPSSPEGSATLPLFAAGDVSGGGRAAAAAVAAPHSARLAEQRCSCCAVEDFEALLDAFQAMDRHGTGRVRRVDFLWAIGEHGHRLEFHRVVRKAGLQAYFYKTAKDVSLEDFIHMALPTATPADLKLMRCWASSRVARDFLTWPDPGRAQSGHGAATPVRHAKFKKSIRSIVVARRSSQIIACAVEQRGSKTCQDPCGRFGVTFPGLAPDVEEETSNEGSEAASEASDGGLRLPVLVGGGGSSGDCGLRRAAWAGA